MWEPLVPVPVLMESPMPSSGVGVSVNDADDVVFEASWTPSSSGDGCTDDVLKLRCGLKLR